MVPPQKPPWEQDPLAFWVPREKREQKTEDSKMYQNTVDIMGFLGADAENRTTKDGAAFTVLSLATKRSWKDAQGEWQSRTDWHRVTGFGAVAEFAASLKKGAHVHITGYLRSREVEKPVNGNKGGATLKFTAWEVRAIRIAKLDRAVEANPDIPADDSTF
ncbi:MAG: single-stranded DNA-binding protein [Terriglobia bacterium]